MEVIVVDNASTDQTAAVALAMGAVVIAEPTRNIARARNTGARSAHGDTLFFLDADTLVPPTVLSRVARLMSEPRCLGGAIDVRHGPSRVSVRLYLRFWRIVGRLAGMAQGAAQFWERERFLNLGGYDESMVYEDFDLWLRITDRFEVRYLPEVLANFRVLPTSLSHSPERTIDVRESRVRALSKWFGTSAPIDDVIARRAWAIGRRTIVDDPRRARGMLRPVLEHQPTLSRRAVYGASYVPGFGQVIRASIALRDRLKP